MVKSGDKPEVSNLVKSKENKHMNPNSLAHSHLAFSLNTAEDFLPSEWCSSSAWSSYIQMGPQERNKFLSGALPAIPGFIFNEISTGYRVKCFRLIKLSVPSTDGGAVYCV